MVSLLIELNHSRRKKNSTPGPILSLAMFISGLYSSSPLCRRKTANLTSSLCPAVHQPFECSKWPSAEFNEMREMSLVSIF